MATLVENDLVRPKLSRAGNPPAGKSTCSLGNAIPSIPSRPPKRLLSLAALVGRSLTTRTPAPAPAPLSPATPRPSPRLSGASNHSGGASNTDAPPARAPPNTSALLPRDSLTPASPRLALDDDPGLSRAAPSSPVPELPPAFAWPDSAPRPDSAESSPRDTDTAAARSSRRFHLGWALRVRRARLIIAAATGWEGWGHSSITVHLQCSHRRHRPDLAQ